MTDATTIAPPAGPSRKYVTRLGLQRALGVLWLVAGALQLQPFMFSAAFAGQVLAPAGSGQPGWVSAGVSWAAGIVAAHPALGNSVFAAIQLIVGLLLLIRPLARIGVLGSIGWALAVWYFGEGLGGIASGHASLLTGAPGAVVLYAIVACLAWPEPVSGTRPGWRRWFTQETSAAPSRWAAPVWAVVWIGGAVLQALPGQNTADELADALDGGMVSWLGPLDGAVADGIRRAGTPAVWLVLAVLVAIGLAGLGHGRLRILAAWAGLVLGVVFWVLGEGFGMLTSGQATDPDSGPLLVLLAVALLGTGLGTARSSVGSTAVGSAAETERGPESGAPREIPAWRSPAPVLSGIGAVAVLGVGLLWWTTSRPLPPPNLGVSAVYTPPGDGASAQVDFTVTNTGAGPDTLLSAGTEFQTAAAAKGVLVCATPSCAQPATVTIPAHSTMIFGAGGPDVVVSGLGPLASGHQPLQLTLTFARSGVVHVLSPVGSATDLTENDVMTYGYMGHAEPGMGMDDDMPGMTGMPGPSASRTPQPMPGMTTPGGH